MRIHSAKPTARPLAARWRWAAGALLLLLAGVGTFFGGRIPSPDEALYAWALERGHAAYGERSLRELLPLVPRRLSAAVDTPALVVDIAFTDMQFLHARREEALRERTLVQREDDFVPASIRHGRQSTEVQLRLKGDFTDHLDSDKWSFRVHVRGGDQIFGLRRFSLQHPRVRGYQGEALFFEYLRRIGALAPRYFFADLTVNGSEVGIMAVEEHFSKELLESQSRREGVMLKFDESLLWQERVTRGIDTWLQRRNTSYVNSPIDVFRRGSILESPALSKDLDSSVALLRGFVEGGLAPSEVFDPEATARFLAACELWSARHALFWNNLRFYFDPVTLRLEPIAFDAAVSPRPDNEEIHARQEPIIARMLEDPELAAAYERQLRQLSSELLEGTLIEELRALEERQLAILRKEFVLLEGYPFDALRARARYLLEVDPLVLRRKAAPRDVYPELLQALLVFSDGDSLLELGSRIPHSVQVLSASWVAADGAMTDSLAAGAENPFPLTLPPTEVGSVPQLLRIPLDSPADPGSELELRARIVGQEGTQTQRARPYAGAKQEHPLRALERLYGPAAHPFVDVDETTRELRVRAGDWRVRGDLVVPRGYGLRVPAGTRLRFEASACLIASGATWLDGSERSPIVLEGQPSPDGTNPWGGVVVLQDGARSVWSHVDVRGTHGVQREWWTLTGGVSFRGGEVELRACRFRASRCEDALNLITCELLLDGITIEDTTSDGLDIDFGRGEIRHIRFRDVGSVSGGDALDLSGSTISLDDAEFERVRDKALSVGEASTLRASAVRVRAAGVGAASKDGSRLELVGARFEEIAFAALAAYVKKPVYGPGHIDARDLDFADLAQELQARVQTDCSITIEGSRVPTENLDVDRLYETIMQPGLRR